MIDELKKFDEYLRDYRQAIRNKDFDAIKDFDAQVKLQVEQLQKSIDQVNLSQIVAKIKALHELAKQAIAISQEERDSLRKKIQGVRGARVYSEAM